MTNIAKIKSLLSNFSSIRKKYRLIEQKTGARFNVYSIAGIERREETTHSRMITELLNPKGRHGQGVVFLNLFLEVIGEANECVASGENIVVKGEMPITGEDKDGRIDIYIETQNVVVVIENKIDAIDQPKQIERYWIYAKSRGKLVKVFYLTPDGREPSKQSLGDIDKLAIKDSNQVIYQRGAEPVDLRLITYSNEIIQWLESCLCYSIKNGLPSVTEGINQYFKLVKKIVGAGMGNEEKSEIYQLLKSTENILSAKEITRAFSSPEFRGGLLFSFMSRLQNELAKKGFSNHKAENQEYSKLEANEKSYIEWCERGAKKNNWEYKGFFMTVPNNLNLLSRDYLLHVQFATSAFHFGLAPRIYSANLENNKTPNDLPKDWEKRSWKNLVWYSKIADPDAYKFQNETLRLFTSPEKIEDLAKQIADEIDFISKKWI